MNSYVSVKRLFDEESNQTYEVTLSEEDALRCKSDPAFAQSMLLHAKCTGSLQSNTALQWDYENEEAEEIAESSNDKSAESVRQSSLNISEQNKRRRFRFSDTERIKCIKELIGILSEDGAETEVEVWSKLHEILINGNPDRFSACSLRLLKEHTLDQISKYKKYDSEGATKSDKERLKTLWGETMKDLMPVWDNYQQLRKSLKSNKQVGRPKKVLASEQKEDLKVAKHIRETALEPIEEHYLFGGLDVNNDILETVNEVDEFSDSTDCTQSTSPSTSRHVVKSATKWRNNKEGTIFSYLAEKARLDNEFKRDQLKLQAQQHSDNVRLQEEALLFKKAKLEHEKEKWRQEAEHRKVEMERNNLLFSLLQTLVQKKEK